ncbi:DNA-binding response regulator [Limnohabitans sp. TS-CS-82]|uniref:response regulator transcription factor n=1 Tax=Limnohabitans sp. TS-CS-82 TaxID=2094193 RepID=UPI000CF22E07|nr:response regulator transcription factor [Limnohabitans sp. TS-CS-82]PQA82913.1 DNA-binding response regulator [Limnohabitans sp. TS-CS-82]
MAHLLIVEDDDLLRDGLTDLFRQAGHTVDHCADGLSAQTLLSDLVVDAVLLDLGLPKLDGMALLKWLRLRFESLPVMILTARDGVDDRVEGLMAGADDYLTKPFNNAELSARMQALLRRARLPAFQSSVVDDHDTKQALEIDPDLPRMRINGHATDLTQREWELLRLLHQRLNQVVSRDDVAAAWQSESAEPTASNALEVYIHRLRRKLNGSGLNIRNVRGLGYMLEPV